MANLTNLLVFVCLTALAVRAQRRPASNDNLVAVVQAFRHGHRTPVGFYTNDPYSDKSYWNGLDVGQLTNEGKRQHYALGQFTRRRYGNWLPERYDKDDIYAYTTDVDRTHMSGQSNLNGLYPARGDQRWRVTSDWQAIPLHPADSVIFSSFPSCSSYYTGWANVLTSDDFTAINEDYADTYAYLTTYSGDNITSISTAYTVYDSFNSENDIRLRLPRWAAPVFPQPLYNLIGHYFASFSYTTQLKRLAIGPFLNEVVEYFEDMAEDSTSSQKYQIYSGHDVNIASILNAFDAFNPPYPPAFASSVYLELRTRGGEYYINTWSKNNDDFKPISVRGCALDCPLSEFKERLSEIAIDSNTFTSECSTTSRFDNPTAESFYKNFVSDNGIEKLRKQF